MTIRSHSVATTNIMKNFSDIVHLIDYSYATVLPLPEPLLTDNMFCIYHSYTNTNMYF